MTISLAALARSSSGIRGSNSRRYRRRLIDVTDLIERPERRSRRLWLGFGIDDGNRHDNLGHGRHDRARGWCDGDGFDRHKGPCVSSARP